MSWRLKDPYEEEGEWVNKLENVVPLLPNLCQIEYAVRLREAMRVTVTDVAAYWMVPQGVDRVESKVNQYYSSSSTDSST